MNAVKSIEGTAQIIDAGTGEVRLSSVTGEDPAYGGVEWVIDAGLTPNVIETLTLDWMPEVGGCGGGAPRLSIGIEGNNVHMYLGTPPNYNDPASSAWIEGQNFAGGSDPRFDLSQYGGTQTGTWADLLALLGDKTIDSIGCYVDGGWHFDAAGQVSRVRGAQFASAITEPPVTTDPEMTPLLRPGTNYFFRMVDSYEFEATLVEVHGMNRRGRPAVLRVQRGEEIGWININAVAVAWERPGTF